VLLYEQPGDANIPRPQNIPRAKFDVNEFANRWKLGDPVNATYFYSSAGAA
jgi:hypothetical protein